MSSTEEMLRKAVAAYQAGRLAEAEAGYQAVLRQQPRSHLALYGLALLSYYAGATQQAIDYVRRSLAFEPNVGLTWNWFGTLCIQTDRLAEGKAAFKRATELSPQSGEAWSNLAHCLFREQNLDGAADLLRRSLNCPQPTSKAFESLTNILCQQGRLPEAARTAAAWLAREPANPIARHMAASVSGQDPPPRASDEYVRTHFDAFAEAGFDAALHKLNYRGPELAAAYLRACADRDSLPPFPAILDAGCGTGLCGPHLRELCSRLVGVDLSEKMLHYAKERGCYDELVVAELSAYLRSQPGAFDAIVCADTFIYFGALAEPLGAAHAALHAGGTLIFTVEALPERDPADHRLAVTGRYLHSEAYLRRVLGESGFKVESVVLQSLRKDAGKDVPGYLAVARLMVSPDITE